jgi:hypothetical protein
MPHPLHHSLWLFITGQDKAAFKLLRRAAKADPLAAGVCLGLEPNHGLAKEWLKTASENGEALYWAGKIWQMVYDEIAHVTHSSALARDLMKHPQWYYHWLRDLEGADLNAKLANLWPDPWAVELIVDRQISKSVVIDLCAKRELDPKHTIESAVILWAADYVLP